MALLDDVFQLAYVTRPSVVFQACKACGENRRAFFLNCCADFSRNCCASNGISSRRSRSGGKCIWTTFNL